MKKIIIIIFAIAIFQIPTIFAQTFIENRYFHNLEGGSSPDANYTGMYENKLIFINTRINQLCLVNGENPPINLIDFNDNIEDNFKRNGVGGDATEFMIDADNNYIELDDYQTGSYRDIAKDNSGNVYFVDNDGKLFAYDEEGLHTELFDCGEAYMFIGMTVNDDYIFFSQYTNEGSMITKIPKAGGENIVFNYTDLGTTEISCVKFSNNNQEIIILKQTGVETQVCKLENDGNLTNLFEITENLTGSIRMSASIDENDNYHVLITGQNGSLEIIYKIETDIKNLQNTQISIFPNPTNGIINIETQEQIEKITILDISGKIILETTNTEIDLSKQKTGTYFVKIETESDIFTEKIILK